MMLVIIVFVVSFLVCFFFQAEDGIRDGHVTGVQTCALPIYSVFHWIEQKHEVPYRYWKEFTGTYTDGDFTQEKTYQMFVRDRRSEERRVGKEWRYRGWADK